MTSRARIRRVLPFSVTAIFFFGAFKAFEERGGPSIVHHRGIATDAVAKCKLIKWFKPGDQIAISPDSMRAIFLALLMFRNELHREQFEPTTFILEG
jgi:hypothetical protein